MTIAEISEKPISKRKLSQYKVAEELELYLGSPFEDQNIFSFKNASYLDETERYPSECIAELHRWGFQEYYIPENLGGKLKSFDELLMLSRVVSRRDLNVAITDAHTYLGSIPIWLAGTPEQKKRHADFVSQSKSACLAITERHHGSDLMSCEFEAKRCENGFLIYGEKWPINKATNTDLLCVLAKTDNQKKARSFSVFLIDKSKLDKDCYNHLPKIKTLGIRSCDISGIHFENAKVQNTDLIGLEGEGLEITLKGFQITRTLCAGLSLGALDTAFRTTLNFAINRQLYGNTVVAIPYTRKVLAENFIQLLSCECVSIASVRGLHVGTSQCSIWSAVVKNYVPVQSEKIVQQLSVILGSRYYFRENHDNGVFQKVLRDNAIISLFDGSTLINLNALSIQLKFLVSKRRAKKNHEKLFDNLSVIFDLTRDLPDFKYEKLDLFSKGNNWVLQGLENLVLKLDEIYYDISSKVMGQIKNLTYELINALNVLENRVDELEAIENGNSLPAEYFKIANNYCAIHTAACSIYMLYFNQNNLSEYFSKGEWLVLSLQQTLKEINYKQQELNLEYLENAMIELMRLQENNLLFSIIPFKTNN